MGTINQRSIQVEPRMPYGLAKDHICTDATITEASKIQIYKDTTRWCGKINTEK
jgi:hypothetical protein